MTEPTTKANAQEPTEGSAEDSSEPGIVDRIMDRVDAGQRRFRPIAFTVAVFKRFSEDRGSQYAALLGYYGFFSLLALLLVAGTVLAAVLANDPARQKELIETITNQLPVTGSTVSDNVSRLGGSGVALFAGVLFLFWSGLGAINAAQDAFNTMWGVPRFRWPAMWQRALRSLAVVAVVGVAIGLVSIGGPIVGTLQLPLLAEVGTRLVAVGVYTAVLLLCFELLVTTRIGLRRLVAGAVVGAVGLVVLQFVGTWYMTGVVTRAGAFYGVFAAAIGLLVWITLQVRILLLAFEVNVVREKVLWPRSITGRNLGPADRRALEDAIEREAMLEQQHVTTVMRDADREATSI